MGAAEHRVHRVVFEVSSRDRAGLDRFGEEMRGRFGALVVPALEAALDRIDRPGEGVRLERVEVDLRGLDLLSMTADDLARRIGKGLGDAIQGRAGPAATRALPRDDAEELAGFLRTGALPWAEPGRTLEALVARLAALEPPALADVAARLRAVLIRRTAAERLVRQLPAALVRRIFRALLPDAVGAPLALAFGPDRSLREVRAGTVPESLVAPISLAIRQLARDPAVAEAGDILPLFSELAAPTRPAPPAAPPADEALARLSDPGDDQTPPAPETEEADQPAPRPIYAAGAVLLHPFLAVFFDQLGLLAAPGRFRDRGCRARAVLLAHHLATGAEDAPEPECGLFKLLTGTDLAEPVPRSITLMNSERQEAEALLTSVIAHWKRLGNTSPAGLREGFLLRPGRLARLAEGWRLTVERRGVDVLLDGLPWALSRVKTPFMSAPLAVDWR